jgi:hypothetical protein
VSSGGSCGGRRFSVASSTRGHRNFIQAREGVACGQATHARHGSTAAVTTSLFQDAAALDNHLRKRHFVVLHAKPLAVTRRTLRRRQEYAVVRAVSRRRTQEGRGDPGGQVRGSVHRGFHAG